ncbi:MAG: hypothetical protein HN350_13390 [Phycisphaerales bacterium]|jgi:hypothetical protein|nr:hypothetical protein [Phycisphaerales bacterium]
MNVKNLTKTNGKTCLETLKGLQTLVEMQQMLIAEALERLDPQLESDKTPKSRSTSGKKPAKA